jgi:short-subunit dehydrogenase
MTDGAPRVVLITGASSGIGAAVARELAGPRFRMALVARRAERLAALVEQVRGGGGEALAIAADLIDPDAPRRILDATIRRFGRLDVLINNAGMGLPQPFERTDPVELGHQIRINLEAPIILTRRALPFLIERRGSIINVGSSITSAAVPIFGVYGATKAGLAYWNDALRRELRQHGVSVSLVEPGPVATEFFQAVAALGESRPRPAVCVAAVDDEARESVRGGPVRAQAERFDSYAPNGAPPAFLTASVGRVARRIVHLIDHPRRRVAILRRTVWPFRVFGGIVQVVPALGDALIAAWLRRAEMARAPEENAADARPPG